MYLFCGASLTNWICIHNNCFQTIFHVLLVWKTNSPALNSLHWLNLCCYARLVRTLKQTEQWFDKQSCVYTFRCVKLHIVYLQLSLHIKYFSIQKCTQITHNQSQSITLPRQHVKYFHRCVCERVCTPLTHICVMSPHSGTAYQFIPLPSSRIQSKGQILNYPKLHLHVPLDYNLPHICHCLINIKDRSYLFTRPIWLSVWIIKGDLLSSA